MVWDPFEEMRRMHEEMDRMFGRVFGSGLGGQNLLPGKSGGGSLTKGGYRMPSADVYETESKVIATFEVPGASKDGIDLNVTEDGVEIKVEQKSERKKEDEKKGSYQYESSSQQFYRRLPLPAEVDPDKAEATYKDGVLRVEMPKVAPSKGGKRIQVK